MNKYRIYIDEVGNPDLKSSDLFDNRFLSLTGVIFNLNYVKDILTPDIESLKAKYFIAKPDQTIIFHRKELLHKKPPFSVLKDPILEKKFNDDFLFLLNKWEFIVISVLIDKRELDNRYSIWKYNPYHYSLEIIVERFYKFLQSKNSVGDMMFECRSGKEDIRLKNSYSRIFQNGTHFVKAQDINKYFTSSELKIKPKIANVSGLQLADLLAHPSRRFMFKYYQIENDNKVTFADRIIKILVAKKYDRSISGRIEGYGIKVLP